MSALVVTPHLPVPGLAWSASEPPHAEAPDGERGRGGQQAKLPDKDMVGRGGVGGGAGAV